MSATRVPFDPAAAFVVACESLVCGSVRLVRGNPFPWRDLGLDEPTLFLLWVALKIDAVEHDAASTAKPARRR